MPTFPCVPSAVMRMPETSAPLDPGRFDAARLARLTVLEALRHARSPRMLILTPLLLLFIAGAAWGFADPAADLPADITADTPMHVLFLTSLFVLLIATLGVALLAHDGISRDLHAGVLAIEFAQPLSRNQLGLVRLLGTWIAVVAPTWLACGLAVLLIAVQMDQWPSFADVATFLVGTALVLLWYAILQLLASSLARDAGSAITLGVATWLLFTMLWLLVTLLVAGVLDVGLDAQGQTDTQSDEFAELNDRLDLLSPNGVYQLMLRERLPAAEAPTVGGLVIWAAALGWTVLPTGAYLWRFGRLQP